MAGVLIAPGVSRSAAGRMFIATLTEIIEYYLPGLSLPDLRSAQRAKAERIILAGK